MERLEPLIRRITPWHEESAWPIIMLEGVIAVGFGLWIVVHPGNTESLIIRLIGIYLAVSGVLGLIADFRRYRDGLDMRFTAARHLAMAIVGVVAVVDPNIPRVVAWACIILGLIGLVLVLALKDLGAARWGMLAVSGLTLVFGVLLLWALATGTFLVAVFGLAVIIAGCLLLVHGINKARGTPSRVPLRAS